MRWLRICGSTGRNCGSRRIFRMRRRRFSFRALISLFPTALLRQSRPFWPASLFSRTGEEIPWLPWWDAALQPTGMKRRKAFCRLLWPTAEKGLCRISFRRERRRPGITLWTPRCCLFWRCMSITEEPRTASWWKVHIRPWRKL